MACSSRAEAWGTAGLCVVRAAGVERCESGVLVISIDRLVPVLWAVRTGRVAQMRLGGLAVPERGVGEGPDGEQASKGLGKRGGSLGGVFV